MKNIVTFLFLFFCAQIFAQEKISYSIKHHDEFTMQSGEPDVKAWDFKLDIALISDNTFQACYSKVLTECLFNIKGFRKRKIVPELEPVCFTYQLSDENEITILDKKEVLEQLKAVIEMPLEGMKKKEQKELKSELDYYLEDEEFLDEELMRELVLIHEFDGYQLNVGVEKVLEIDGEEVDFSKLSSEEKSFLEAMIENPVKSIWRNSNAFTTQEISKSLWKD